MDIDKVEKLLSIADKLALDKYPTLNIIREAVAVELAKVNDELEKAKHQEREEAPHRQAGRSR
jgi:hypothetical protein